MLGADGQSKECFLSEGGCAPPYAREAPERMGASWAHQWPAPSRPNQGLTKLPNVRELRERRRAQTLSHEAFRAATPWGQYVEELRARWEGGAQTLCRANEALAAPWGPYVRELREPCAQLRDHG